MVRLFHRPEVNTGGAQPDLHHPRHLAARRADLFRRDQIWLVEKDRAGLHLVALSEFSPRKNEALERGYLMGRYGGVPFLNHAGLATLMARDNSPKGAAQSWNANRAVAPATTAS